MAAKNLDTNNPAYAHLDTQNPDCLLYESGGLAVTVLGGIRTEGLDRLRVTLKIEARNQAIRHNLDLYNDTQVVKMKRRTADRLEVGTSVVGTVLEELTSALESYRLEQLERKQAEEPQPRPLSKEERSQAEAFLKSEGLMERTNELIGQSGVIGEELNRLLMYVIFTSRKRPHPLHVVSLGGSGTGKTWLQEKVGALVPEEDKLEITTLSENAFYYFGQRELQHKLVLIEDLDGLTGGSSPRSGGGGAMYPLRELKSKRVIRKRVAVKNTRGETRTVHLTVEGPVSVAGCTTKEALYEDNANRSFLLYLDESPAQDERIMAYQRKLSAGRIDTEAEQQASELLRIPIATVKRHHRALVESGYLKAAKKNRQQGYRYEITSYEEYQKLQQSIGTVLDDQLERLSSPNPAQKQTEPPKPKKTSRKKPAAQSK